MSKLESKVFSKADLVKQLEAIKTRGWIKTARPGNNGAVGNTLEDLLGIDENNLPIPNAAEWEMKAKRRASRSLTTLFHMEPSPTAAKFVPSLLLPNYGWRHRYAGKKHLKTEMSFRSTTGTRGYTDRGFIVIVDRQERKVKFSFNAAKANPKKHGKWLVQVEKRVGLDEITPQPYWGFDDLMYKAGSKLRNCFYVLADNKWEDGNEFFYFSEVDLLTSFNFEGFLDCIDDGTILIDFDARTGHNHGTKFRIRQNNWPRLYKEKVRVV